MCCTTFYWTEDLILRFSKTAVLNEEEITILRMSILNRTIKEIADTVCVSTSTVSRRLRIMRKKYDSLVEAGYDFPPRNTLHKQRR